eukprot:CAMPEP_0170123770 /NCGR_PEP_ID=MMETSP0020_2-20130122/17722_1 /TAXON_ID=98059 /ORGANISM="Dinobryon sp., Strain UTEXLB2267" /LENGTH=1045 /DNA_ID=CAMNT_0010355461 /DNA_START=536 /DNA_END=3677 /DNA_ORIENTATION=-
MVIPSPIASIVARSGSDNKLSQEILVFPTLRAASFEDVLGKLLRLSHHLRTANEGLRGPLKVSRTGCPVLDVPNVQGLLRVAKTALADADLAADLKMGVHWDSSRAAKQSPGGDFGYQLEGPSSEPAAPAATPAVGKPGKAKPADPGQGEQGSRSGAELVELVCAQWQESELVSVEDPLHPGDLEALRLLKKKLHEVVQDIRLSRADKLKYHMGGVGGDSLVPLQVVMDSSQLPRDPEGDAEGPQEGPFNALKLRLSSCANVSQALHVCKRARKMGLALIVSCSNDPSQSESADGFLADLAVGAGAGQLMAGGLCGGEHFEKYNRILEICQESPSIPFAGVKFKLLPYNNPIGDEVHFRPNLPEVYSNPIFALCTAMMIDDDAILMPIDSATSHILMLSIFSNQFIKNIKLIEVINQSLHKNEEENGRQNVSYNTSANNMDSIKSHPKSPINNNTNVESDRKNISGTPTYNRNYSASRNLVNDGCNSQSLNGDHDSLNNFSSNLLDKDGISLCLSPLAFLYSGSNPHVSSKKQNQASFTPAALPLPLSISPIGSAANTSSSFYGDMGMGFLGLDDDCHDIIPFSAFTSKSWEMSAPSSPGITISFGSAVKNTASDSNPLTDRSTIISTPLQGGPRRLPRAPHSFSTDTASQQDLSCSALTSVERYFPGKMLMADSEADLSFSFSPSIFSPGVHPAPFQPLLAEADKDSSQLVGSDIHSSFDPGHLDATKILYGNDRACQPLQRPPQPFLQYNPMGGFPHGGFEEMKLFSHSVTDDLNRSKALQAPPEPPEASLTMPASALVRSASLASLNTSGELEEAASARPHPLPCKCKKSRCLKLYCDCFALLKVCGKLCSCRDCFNLSGKDHEQQRNAAIESIKEKNPLAFQTKISGAEGTAQHAAGCHCKQSHCLKKYCECFHGGANCGTNCKCQNCKNYSNSKELLDVAAETPAPLPAATANASTGTSLQAKGRTAGGTEPLQESAEAVLAAKKLQRTASRKRKESPTTVSVCSPLDESPSTSADGTLLADCSAMDSSTLSDKTDGSSL